MYTYLRILPYFIPTLQMAEALKWLSSRTSTRDCLFFSDPSCVLVGIGGNDIEESPGSIVN